MHNLYNNIKIIQIIKSQTLMKKVLSLAVLFVLTCLLGNGALAQRRVIMKPVTETIDFTGLPAPDGINQYIGN